MIEYTADLTGDSLIFQRSVSYIIAFTIFSKSKIF